jgi:hypothetical protein
MAEVTNTTSVTTVTSSDTSSGTATVLSGEALAIGDETLTWVDAISTMVDHGEVTIATGEVTATAISTDEAAYADAMTDTMVAGADIVIIKTKNTSGSADGSSYDVSVTKFKVISVEHRDGAMRVIYSNKETHNADATIDIDGNVAVATFDAQASGENTLVSVDASVLVIEDQLSLSTMMIDSAVG